MDGQSNHGIRKCLEYSYGGVLFTDNGTKQGDLRKRMWADEVSQNF